MDDLLEFYLMEGNYIMESAMACIAKIKSVWWKYTNIGGMRLLTGMQIYACLQYPILIPEAI